LGKTIVSTEASDISVEAILREQNPNLCNDPMKLSESIDVLDLRINEILITRPQTWRIVVNILLQARNPLANILGVEKRYVDYVDITVEKTNPVPIEKFVILLCNNSTMVRSIKAILPTALDDDSRFKILDSRSAICAIIEDMVAGIVDFNYHSTNYTTADLAYSLRHDLKNHEGWNQEKADNKILPPLSITSIHQVHNGFRVALDMANGAFHSAEVSGENVDLAQYCSSFLARMKIPTKDVSVLIVDDSKTSVRGMLFLLDIWPNIKVSSLHEFGNNFPEPKQVDIVLLDHDLGIAKFNGGELLNFWQSSGDFKSVVISTTGGDRQPYGSYHFPKKSGVTFGNLESCNEFIALINQILETQ
jgi:hypothetical protein